MVVTPLAVASCSADEPTDPDPPQTTITLPDGPGDTEGNGRPSALALYSAADAVETATGSTQASVKGMPQGIFDVSKAGATE